MGRNLNSDERARIERQLQSASSISEVTAIARTVGGYRLMRRASEAYTACERAWFRKPLAAMLVLAMALGACGARAPRVKRPTSIYYVCEHGNTLVDSPLCDDYQREATSVPGGAL